MARRCDICGKGVMTGNRVSKSLRHTKRVFRPNIHIIKGEFRGAEGIWKICTKCMKTNKVSKTC